MKENKKLTRYLVFVYLLTINPRIKHNNGNRKNMNKLSIINKVFDTVHKLRKIK